METSTKSPTPHIGRKIARMREMLGVKQEALALGLGISQQAVSKLEQSEKVDDSRIEEVANVLGVTPHAIRNFNEDMVFNNINNTFNEGSSLVNYQFNPIDKIVELYDALLKEKDEKIALLERFLGEGKEQSSNP